MSILKLVQCSHRRCKFRRTGQSFSLLAMLLEKRCGEKTGSGCKEDPKLRTEVVAAEVFSWLFSDRQMSLSWESTALNYLRLYDQRQWAKNDRCEENDEKRPPFSKPSHKLHAPRSHYTRTALKEIVLLSLPSCATSWKWLRSNACFVWAIFETKHQCDSSQRCDVKPSLLFVFLDCSHNLADNCLLIHLFSGTGHDHRGSN